MTAAARYLTITLTGEPPVRILTGDWKVIARSLSRRALQAVQMSRDPLRFSLFKEQNGVQDHPCTITHWSTNTRW